MAIRYWASTSSTDPSLAANWLTAAGATGAPANGDTLIVQGLQTGTAANIANYDQSAVQLAELRIEKSYIGTIGSATSPWKIGADEVNIGGGEGTGSGRIFIDFGSTETKITVMGSASVATDANREAVRLVGTHADNELFVSGGIVGFATSVPGIAGTLAKLQVSGTSTVVRIGDNVTWTAIENTGATLTVNSPSASGTLTVLSGTTTTNGIGKIGIVNVIGGTYYANHRAASGDSFDDVNLQGGTLDFTLVPRALSIGTLNDAGGEIVGSILSQWSFTTYTEVAGNNLRKNTSFSAT